MFGSDLDQEIFSQSKSPYRNQSIKIFLDHFAVSILLFSCECLQMKKRLKETSMWFYSWKLKRRSIEHMDNDIVLKKKRNIKDTQNQKKNDRNFWELYRGNRTNLTLVRYLEARRKQRATHLTKKQKTFVQTFLKGKPRFL